MLPDINTSQNGSQEVLVKNSDKRSKYADKSSANGSIGASGHLATTDGSVQNSINIQKKNRNMKKNT